MKLNELLASDLPDSVSVTLGWLRQEIRGTEEMPQGGDWEDEVVRIAVQRCTEHYLEDSWAAREYGRTQPDDGESTPSPSTSDEPDPRST